MRYRKATEVLPEELVEAIQKYMDGGYVYIPRKEENKKKWGGCGDVFNDGSIIFGEFY